VLDGEMDAKHKAVYRGLTRHEVWNFKDAKNCPAKHAGLPDIWD